MGQWYTWIIAIVLGVGLGLFLQRNKQVNTSAIHVLSKEDFFNNMRKGQLIDIRKKEAFEQDKIKGARNFKPAALTGKYFKIRKDKSVYLYCSNGKKSQSLARKMSKEGYTAIYILDGGFENNK